MYPFWVAASPFVVSTGVVFLFGIMGAESCPDCLGFVKHGRIRSSLCHVWLI